MKKSTYIILILFFAAINFQTFAQNVGINDDNSAPDNRAILDVKSTSKGVLFPRLTDAQRNVLLTNVPEGMLIYNTTSQQLQIFINNGWYPLLMGSPITIPNLATVTTTVVSGISKTTAVCGGNVVSEGLTSVTARGVVYSTTQNPTITSNTGITSDGTGIGAFTSSLSGLIASTTYYVRAYATNTAGTVYGSQNTFTTSATFAIGDSYAGGIVFYIDGTGAHGLVCSAADNSSGTVWGCNNTSINGADGIAIGTGNQNTTDILNGCATAGIAARVCRNLSLNGFSDWFLPSKNELNLMYTNLKSNVAANFTGTKYYWTSTEYSEGQAWYQNFGTGAQYYFSKTQAYYVRAVRAF